MTLRPRLVFFGLPGHGAIALQALLQAGIRPALTVTADAGPVPLAPGSINLNRRRDALLRAYPDPGELSRNAGIPCYRDAPDRDLAPLLQAVQDAHPDLILIATYFRILPEAVFALPRLGTFNLHPSLLPACRGPQPLYWALRRGEAETGVTLHRVDAGIDTGPVCAQQRVPLTADDTFATACRRLDAPFASLAVAAVTDAALRAQQTAQDATQASFHPVPDAAARALQPATWTVQETLRAVRAGNPVFPVFLQGEDFTCIVWEAEAAAPRTQETILAVENDTIYCRCADGVVRFTAYDLCYP